MKYYKSFILLGMFALSFASCNTDDLERNIDELTTRVEDMEKQVQALNDNMNVIRVLLDGNKTIQSYTYDEATGTYTLVLSDGQTMTLTQGNDDNITYPQVTVGDNGNWFVDGVDTGQRAKAQDGTPVTVTPQFQIVTEGTDKVWQVSYDEGATWDYVTDETGAHVKATGTVSGTNPIEAVKVENGCLSVTVDGTEYTIPIVEGLVCQIVEPENVENDTWYVAKGGDGTDLTVNVNLESGDIVRAVAPADWTVTVPDYSALTGEQALTLSVRAPETPSECVLSVEVTRGVHTAASEIKVHTTTDSYYADFMAGLDIQVGNVKINKYMFGEDVTISLISSDAQISSGGLYFISDKATVKASSGNYITLATSDMLLVGDSPNTKSVINWSSSLILKGYSVYWKNVDVQPIDGFALNNFIDIQADAGANTKDIAIDGCNINIPAISNQNNPSFLQVRGTYVVENLSICNSEIMNGRQADKQILRFINLSDNTAETILPNVQFNNNLFYSNQNEGNTGSPLIFVQNNNTTNVGVTNLELKSNTFANTSNAGGGLLVGEIANIAMEKNIFIPPLASSNNMAVIRRRQNADETSESGVVTSTMTGIIKDNIGFSNRVLNMIYNGNAFPDGVDGEEVRMLTSNPYSTYEPSIGNFVISSAYADYGHQAE